MRSLALAIVMCALCQSGVGHAREPSPRSLRPDYVRTAAEVGASLAVATVWYVVDDRNVLDWDKPSLASRFTGEAWRFDNNTFGINSFFHPVVEGGGMYLLARGNRLGVAPAFAASALGSTVWEFAIEFNEKVSINDMWITPVGGLPVGEFLHKLARKVAHPSRSPTARALAWTLGFPVYVHRRMDGVDGAAVEAGEEPPPDWHAASFRYGFGGGTDNRGAAWRGVHVLTSSTRFVSIPGYLGPQTFGRWFHDAEIASLDLTLDFGPRAFGVDANAEVVLGGWHFQTVPEDAKGHLANTVGIAASYTYRSTRAFGFDDREGIVGFPGLVWEARAARGSCTASLGARAALGFGSMSAPSFAAYQARDPEARTKTVLRREGYAFGWDLKARGDARLGCGAIELRGGIGNDRFASIQGLDRNQEEITDDVRVVEHAWRYGASAWVSAAPLPLSFGVSLDARFRRSGTSTVESALGGYRTIVGVELTL